LKKRRGRDPDNFPYSPPPNKQAKHHLWSFTLYQCRKFDSGPSAHLNLPAFRHGASRRFPPLRITQNPTARTSTALDRSGVRGGRPRAVAVAIQAPPLFDLILETKNPSLANRPLRRPHSSRNRGSPRFVLIVPRNLFDLIHAFAQTPTRRGRSDTGLGTQTGRVGHRLRSRALR